MIATKKQLRTRIWDLPTRIFHWALLGCIVGLVVTGKTGGNAMQWHLQLGHAVLALLLFRMLWGLVGGHWSRFASFLYSPRRTLDYLKNRQQTATPGHSPIGALSVFALLGTLFLQVGTGLFADDEIAFSGSLSRFVSGDAVSWATWVHKDIGLYILLGLIVVHLLAIAFYTLVRKHALVAAMVHGDKVLSHPAPATKDNALTRTLGLILLLGCAGLSWWLLKL